MAGSERQLAKLRPNAGSERLSPKAGSDCRSALPVSAALSPMAGPDRWSPSGMPPRPPPAGSSHRQAKLLSNPRLGQALARAAPSERRMNAESGPTCAKSSPSAGWEQQRAEALAAETAQQSAWPSPKVESGPVRPARARRRRASSAPHRDRTPGAPARGDSHAAPPAPRPPCVKPPWRVRVRPAAACQKTSSGSGTPQATCSAGQERCGVPRILARASRAYLAAKQRSTRERVAPRPEARSSPAQAPVCAGQEHFHVAGQRVSAWPEASTAPHAEPPAG